MPHDSTTQALAERHEALWLSLSALHKDMIALGAKKPQALVSEPVRVSAEGLLSDCAPFIRRRGERLPVAAPDLAGLAVQLGQALAALDAWESLHTIMDARFNCKMWNLDGNNVPVMRLKPPTAVLNQPRTDYKGRRDKLGGMIQARIRGAYKDGFDAGRAARIGPPADGAYPPGEGDAEPADAGAYRRPEQTNPRLRLL
ncbi:hypothetical protein [Devosia sp.]|uniref:hypothetical protein n=1 Tax=Devosia sp. TaxID=1871048 RepID=UPI002FCB2D71